MTDSNGCINYDTIYVSKHTAPVVELGNDTTICREHDFEISAYAPSAVSILWNDGTETFSRMSTGAHEYSITVMDVHGCVNYDTLDIDTFESPVPVINIQDTSICMGDSVGLEVEDVYVFYAWTNTSSTVILQMYIVQTSMCFVCLITTGVWDQIRLTWRCLIYHMLKLVILYGFVHLSL